MPYLQLDVPTEYPEATKKALAAKLGATYARLMQTTPHRVSVGFRELTNGSLWRCADGDPVPGVVLMCDIRRGRPTEWREQLAVALLDLVSEHLELPRDRMAIEFTQHAGDEMFRADEGWAKDWTETEAQPA
jgi:phenylpyruvate tautomerase PptA (4-oxalocrotonate tautomerase family)